MSLYDYDPESEKRPYLPVAGRYGTGQPNGGDVKWTDFIPSCREAAVKSETPDFEAGPGYDRKCERDDYARFQFQVQHPVHGLVNIFDWQPLRAHSGSKLLPILRALKVPMEDTTGPDGKPRQRLHFETVEKILANGGVPCVVEIGEPSQSKKDKTVHYTGNLIAVFGLD